MQLTNFKFQSHNREAIAQILNQSKKNLEKEASSDQLAYGLVVDLTTLPDQ